jgi:hypothetical protein
VAGWSACQCLHACPNRDSSVEGGRQGCGSMGSGDGSRGRPSLTSVAAVGVLPAARVAAGVAGLTPGARTAGHVGGVPVVGAVGPRLQIKPQCQQQFLPSYQAVFPGKPLDLPPDFAFSFGVYDGTQSAAQTRLQACGAADGWSSLSSLLHQLADVRMGVKAAGRVGGCALCRAFAHLVGVAHGHGVVVAVKVSGRLATCWTPESTQVLTTKPHHRCTPLEFEQPTAPGSNEAVLGEQSGPHR